MEFQHRVLTLNRCWALARVIIKCPSGRLPNNDEAIDKDWYLHVSTGPWLALDESLRQAARARSCIGRARIDMTAMHSQTLLD